MREVETVQPLAPLPTFSRKIHTTPLFNTGQRINSPESASTRFAERALTAEIRTEFRRERTLGAG